MKKYIFLCTMPIIVFGIVIYSFVSKKTFNSLINKGPLVSVVMPTYNRADLLPRSIDSILNQTYTNFEFIIVDDGSTDSTHLLLETYAQSDPRIKILTNETNKGISYSRNRGTDAAKGKYIAIMDSDDYSEPERLKKHVDYLEKHEEVTALNALYYEIGKESSWQNNWVPPLRFDIIFYLKNYFSNIAVFRTDFVRKHNIRYDENIMSSEDYDFWAKIFMKGGKLRMLNDRLIHLRRHTTNSPEYYDSIKKHARLISDRLLKHFGIKNPENFENDCERMEEMIKVNNQTQKLDSYTLNLFYSRSCKGYPPPKNGLYIKHEDWVDYLKPTEEKNVYERLRNKERYKIIDVKENEYNIKNIFVIESPKNEIEIYQLQRDGSLGLLKKQEKSFLKKLFN